MLRYFLGILLCSSLATQVTAEAVQGYFGAQLTEVLEADVPAAQAEDIRGVLVLTVLPESPAAAAGFAANDIILAVGGVPMVGPTETARHLASLGAGAEVEVQFMRNAEQHSTKLRLGINPWQNADQPDPSEAYFGVREYADLAYGGDDRHKLDLYVPDTGEPMPMLLWIHGGGWSFGDRKQDRSLALRLAERGVAVASMSYRLSAGRWADPNAPAQGVVHPAHINDVADAFVWLQAQAQRYGYDETALYVGGHSAGGHLAALLATDADYLRARGASLEAVAGAVPIGGAYDIPDYHAALISGDPEMGQAHIEAVFGKDPLGWVKASPTAFIETSAVPMLVVVEEQAGFERYARRLEVEAHAAGRDNVAFLSAKGRTHGNVLLLMSGRHEDSVRHAILRFLHSGQVKVLG